MDLPLHAIPVPFRMQPGLLRLGPKARILTPLDPASALAGEKRAVADAGLSRWCTTDLDPELPVYAIGRRAAAEGLTGSEDEMARLEDAFEDDFALIDTATGDLKWMSVCTPSHWAPEEKLGLHFTQLHAPVADNHAILAATKGLMALIGRGDLWERHVWTLSPSPRYDQHPYRQPRAAWPEPTDTAALLAAAYLRAERQCFFPVPQAATLAIFTIRVMIEPLKTTVQRPHWAHRLSGSLASMSPAVLAYKGLDRVRDRLVQALRSYF